MTRVHRSSCQDSSQRWHLVLCPKLQVNSLSWGREDQEELVGTSLLPSVPNSR